MSSVVRLAVSAAAIALIVVAISRMSDLSPSPSNVSPNQHAHPVSEPIEVIEALGRELARVEAGSPAAIDLTDRIHRVRRLASKTRIDAENPGALLEALARLKTSRDGRTYNPDYKMRALRKAESRAAGKSARVLPWIERGPGNVSGRIRAVIVDRSDLSGNTWWAASIGGGVWKTSNAGQTWIEKTPTLTTLTTTTLVQAPSNPDVFYVGTGMGYGRVVDLEGSGIWKSVDHGETWFQLASTADGQLLEAVNRIVVDPNNADILLACTNSSFSHLGVEEGGRPSGIFRSTDGGESWTKVFDPLPVFGSATDNRVQQIVADLTDFNKLYATVNEVGVIKSIDGGITWEVSADNFALPSDIGNPPGNGLGLAGISVRTEMAIAPSDPNRLYAAVERPRGVADLYVSKNGGETWILTSDTGSDPNWFNSFGQSGATGAYTAGWFDNTIAVHPFDEDVVFVGGVQLYRIDFNPSNNTRQTVQIASGGSSNPNASLPYVHPDHHFLTMIPDDPASGAFRILDANDGGVAVSADGGVSWQHQANIGTTQFYGVDKKPGESAYIGGTQDNGTWISGVNPDERSVWRHVIAGDGFEAVWNFRDPNLLLGGSQFNILSRSADGGSTWLPIPDFPASPGQSLFITKLANSKVDPDLVFAVSTLGIVRTDDFGASWTVSSVAGNWIGQRPFDNVEVSNADPQVVWISSRMDLDPALGRRGGIHVSDDGGLTFTEVSANFPPALAEAAGIATDPVDRNTAYILFAGPAEPKVMRTTDLGQTWDDLSGFGGTSKTAIGISPNGFPDVAAFSLLVMPFDTEVLWAGTEIGLFESVDGGRNWSMANNGFPNAAIFEMSIVDDQVVVATQGRGIWTVTLPELQGYSPPTVTLAPRLTALALLPSGSAAIEADLRSSYDSTVVLVDGVVFARIGANADSMRELLDYSVTSAGTIQVSILSYRDGREYRSPPRSLQVFPTEVATMYESDFSAEAASLDFSGSGFTVRQAPGFPDPAIHSPHPYSNAADIIYQLKVPIRVADQNAVLEYDDIALIEEGISSNYTDVNFFDYVIVEGTKDGTTWLPLAPGYDARFNATWSQTYRNGIPAGGVDSQAGGGPAMFVRHEVNLHDTFGPRDVIFVRFRLHADPLARAWGWVIDNLEIQPNAVVAVEGPADIPQIARLGQNFPNPFGRVTTIPFSLEESVAVTLTLHDLTGRLVRTVLEGAPMRSGEQSVSIESDDLAAGSYVYRLTARSSQVPDAVWTQARMLSLVR